MINFVKIYTFGGLVKKSARQKWPKILIKTERFCEFWGQRRSDRNEQVDYEDKLQTLDQILLPKCTCLHKIYRYSNPLNSYHKKY